MIVDDSFLLVYMIITLVMILVCFIAMLHDLDKRDKRIDELEKRLIRLETKLEAFE